MKRIFHPSDFSGASKVAFAHALRLALSAGGDLRLFHVSADRHLGWEEFPGVRDMLHDWGVLARGSKRSAVEALGMRIDKVIALDEDPIETSLAFLERFDADLVVLAVHQLEGRMRWLHRSIGKPIAYASGEPCLLLPHGVPGFVSAADGAVTLEHILIPVAHEPRPGRAVSAALDLVRTLGLPPGTITLLHVGDAADEPEVSLPEGGWTVRRLNCSGEVAQTIVRIAGESGADLVAMTTEGPHGFLDALRGSTSEQVLQRVGCPLLCVPA